MYVKFYFTFEDGERICTSISFTKRTATINERCNRYCFTVVWLRSLPSSHCSKQEKKGIERSSLDVRAGKV